MVEDSLIPEAARAMIGKESSPRVVGEVYKRDIQRFALATDDHNRLYFDEEYANKSRYGGIIAPPAFIYTFSHPDSDAEVAEDGHLESRTGEELRPLLPVKRSMGGGTEAEFFQPLRPGDVISVKKKIVDIYEKEGRSGRLVFIITDTTYTNQRGEVVVIERGTTILR